MLGCCASWWWKREFFFFRTLLPSFEVWLEGIPVATNRFPIHLFDSCKGDFCVISRISLECKLGILYQFPCVKFMNISVICLFLSGYHFSPVLTWQEYLRSVVDKSVCIKSVAVSLCTCVSHSPIARCDMDWDGKGCTWKQTMRSD